MNEQFQFRGVTGKSIRKEKLPRVTTFFHQLSSKRRKGFRVVHQDKELSEKLGRNDLCPCGSGRKFKKCCLGSGLYDGAARHHYQR